MKRLLASAIFLSFGLLSTVALAGPTHYRYGLPYSDDVPWLHRHPVKATSAATPSPAATDHALPSPAKSSPEKAAGAKQTESAHPKVAPHKAALAAKATPKESEAPSHKKVEKPVHEKEVKHPPIKTRTVHHVKHKPKPKAVHHHRLWHRIKTHHKAEKRSHVGKPKAAHTIKPASPLKHPDPANKVLKAKSSAPAGPAIAPEKRVYQVTFGNDYLANLLVQAGEKMGYHQVVVSKKVQALIQDDYIGSPATVKGTRSQILTDMLQGLPVTAHWYDINNVLVLKMQGFQ